jgi:hypothetical protein
MEIMVFKQLFLETVLKDTKPILKFYKNQNEFSSLEYYLNYPLINIVKIIQY